MEFLEGWDGRLGQNIGLSPLFPLMDWLLLGPWQPREKAPSGYGGGGLGQQTQLHLCCLYPPESHPLSIFAGWQSVARFLPPGPCKGCGLELPGKGTVHSSRLEELLRWEGDAILP